MSDNESSAKTNKLQASLARVRVGDAATGAADERPVSDPRPPSPSDRTVEPTVVEPRGGRRRVAEGERWDARNTRATFHVERALLDEIDDVVRRRPEISKSGFVNEAIRRHLADYR